MSKNILGKGEGNAARMGKEVRKAGYWAQKGSRGRRAAALVDTELVLHSKYKSRHLGQQYPEDSHPRESYLIKEDKK